jgi:iron-sulfur cluster repair protein YtfE (RIC family)
MTTLMQPLRNEHQELLPHIEQFRAAADLVGEGPPAELASAVDRAHEFLSQLLLPHAEAEERALYPVVARVMGSAEATATMSRDHQEISRLAEELAHARAQLKRGVRGPVEDQDIRRILYGLYALVKVHFAKEEEVYLPLLERELAPDQAESMFRAMGHAAAAAKQARGESAVVGR